MTGWLVVDGAQLMLDNNAGTFRGANHCGKNCAIRVINGGLFYTRYWAHDSLGGANNGVTLYVGPGSKFLAYKTSFSIDYVKTTVDGGTFEMQDSSTTYVSDLTLKNGAQTLETSISEPGSLRFGKACKVPTLTIEGDSEITMAHPIRLYKDPNASWSGDVQYLVIDTKTDFRMTGGILNSKASESIHYRGLRVRKQGAASLIFDCTQDDYAENAQWTNEIEVCVDAGTLEVRKSNAIVATQALSLYGTGVFKETAGAATTVKKLTVGGQNEMNFAAGASFTAPSLDISESGARLNLTGTVGGTSFRIGTTKCLSAAQLAKLRINNHAVIQDEHGYVVPSGFVFIVQ